MPGLNVAPEDGDGPLTWRTAEKSAPKSGSTLTGVGGRPKYPRHELLGIRDVGGEEDILSWRNTLDVQESHWLTDHVLLNQAVFPASGYIAMAGESMRQLSNGNLDCYTLRNFSVRSALFLNPDEKPELLTTLRPVDMAGDSNEWYEIKISSCNESRWVEQCVGKVCPRFTPGSVTTSLFNQKGVHQRQVLQAYWYDVLESGGLKYGSTFQGLDKMSAALTENEAVATVSSFKDASEYVLHPVTIERCLQILTVAECKGQGRRFTGASVVTAIEHLTVFGDRHGKLKARGKIIKRSSHGAVGDVSVVSEDNHDVLLLSHCETTKVPNDRPKSEDKLFSFVRWETDAAYCDLNQKILSSEHLPECSEVLQVVKILSHKNPKLRILELGNGTDETTRLLLSALNSQSSDRRYLTYTYGVTSFEAAFKAKTALKNTSNISVTFFDTEQQLQSQILQAGAYDLIITTDYFSSARNHISALADCLKQLVHPLGSLVLWELLPGTNTARDTAFVDNVQSTIISNGFLFGPKKVDSPRSPKIIAQLRKDIKYPKQVTLVVPEDHHPLADTIQKALHNNGISCDRRKLSEDLPQSQDMIWVVDFGEPYLYNITEARFRKFANRLSTFKGSMIWVTPWAQTSCRNPNSAMTLGMTRTLRAELRKDITVVEMDTDANSFPNSSKLLVEIYQNLGSRPKSRDIDPDYEYAILNSEIQIPRIHWTTKDEENSECVSRLARDRTSSQSPQTLPGSSSKSTHFRSEASYLLVGGLGGLGRVISTWMVEKGARSILFLSRSAKEGPETTPFFDELRAQGCEVLTFTGSVTSLSDVKTAVKQMTRPLAGVMQMSAVMRDNWMSHMTFAEWDQCVRPKVQGTWNLHEATSSSNLDFFLLFSSICGMSGQWGQANYNSANAFLDAFVNYRHGEKLPASVVDIGFMGCVGMAVENRALVEKLTANGYHFLGERDLIDALILAIGYSSPRNEQGVNKSQLGLGFRATRPLTNPSTRVVWKKDVRMALSHQFESLGALTNDEARKALKTVYRVREDSK